MKIQTFLNDATGASELWSERLKYQTLAAMLNDDGSSEPATVKMIGNWFTRDNIPTRWVFAIVRAAKRAGRDLDLNKYA